MGWQKILENVKAMNARLEVQRTFAASARDINQAIGNAEKSLPDEVKKFAQIRERVEAMDTCGVKEFDDYRRSLLAIVSATGSPRPLPTAPLNKVLEKARAELQSKPEELKAQEQAYFRFCEAAQAINEAVAKTAQAHRAVAETLNQIRERVERLDTFGIKEFEDYKRSLLGMAGGGTLRPLPLEPVYKAISRVESEHLKMVNEYYAKLSASCPSEVKPGMVFKRSSDQVFVEITKGPFKPHNADLKGDKAICFKARLWKDGQAGTEIDYDLAGLKQLKYLKT